MDQDIGGDPEVQAIHACAHALLDLDEDVRLRVIEYLRDRFCGVETTLARLVSQLKAAGELLTPEQANVAVSGIGLDEIKRIIEERRLVNQGRINQPEKEVPDERME